MFENKENGTHYIAHHHSGNMIEVWYSCEPDIIGWVGRLYDGGAIVPLNHRDFTTVAEIKHEEELH